MKRRDFLKNAGFAAAALTISGCNGPATRPAAKEPAQRPNILFCIADDMSWPHAGAYGDKVVKTPNFDRVAKDGILFTNTFCAAPSCTPSRSAILTGQEIWRLEEGGVLRGALPNKFRVYTDLLAAAGYHVGYVHKGWSPGSWQTGGWDHNPAGPKKYSARRVEPSAGGIKKTDYAASFEDFLNDRADGQPFCFWYGCKEPHRSYEKGSGLRSGKRLEDVTVPAFLPDVPEVRSDILDYYVEVEWYDEHLGRMLKKLEQTGLLENTLVVVTSDNGMPFPRAKTNLYDAGTHMPLAVSWPATTKPGRVVHDFISLTDIAPTFLDAANLPVGAEMTGRSFKNILLSDKSGFVDKGRDCVFTALERHTCCRPGCVAYPSRAIRTHQWLYIRNFEPDRWPAGDPDINSDPQGAYGDIDNGPTKTYMIEHKDDPGVRKQFRLGFGKRPAEELYDVRNDPDQINNLADDAALAAVRNNLRKRLEQYLQKTADPRAAGKAPWDNYPYG